MSADSRRPTTAGHRGPPSSDKLWRLAPSALAVALALAYVLISPPSGDLPAHLLRAKLFSVEGFGIWNNWWYAGHNVPGYSVLFPPLAAALAPQLAAGIASTASAAIFEQLAYREYGQRARLGSLWFAAATAAELFAGRLTFAFGLAFALAAALALQRHKPALAAVLAVLTALASPVAALFAALAGGAAVLSNPRRALAGIATVVGALLPVLALAIVFPEGGTEPFAFSAFWPVPILCIAAFLAARNKTLRAGIAVYALGAVASYAIPTAVGSNVARLGTLLAGPLAALFWWRRRTALLLAVALPLLYIQWQAPVSDVVHSSGQPSAHAAFYAPLLRFLKHRPGPPFRLEIPFTRAHAEAYYVAPEFPLARGWERQLDIKYNGLFYDGTLTPAAYQAWLHELAVRFVALANAPLDYSAQQERALIEHGVSYLTLVWRTQDWRVYAVRDPTPIAQGAATLTNLGPNSLTLSQAKPGSTLIHVRFSPYWKLAGGPGCVAPAGQFTRVTVRRAGTFRLVIDFSLTRIGAHSPRCSNA